MLSLQDGGHGQPHEHRLRQCWGGSRLTSKRGQFSRAESCRVVWLAQMVAAMPSIFGDQSRMTTGRMWPWCSRTRRRGGRAGTIGCCVRAAGGIACWSWPGGPGWIRIRGSVGMWCAAGWAVASCLFHPVRDRVAGVGGLVAGPAEPLPDRGDELLLLSGIAGGEAAPSGRGDEAGEGDGFGEGGGEDPGGAELAGFGAGRDEDLGAAGPPLPRA